MKQRQVDTEAGIPLLQDVDSPASNSKGSSLQSAVFNISTTMIGAGIMSIPATFKVLGVFPALLVIVLVSFMGNVTGDFILRYTESGKSTTYAGLMGESFGRIGSLALQLCVMLTSFGCLVIYLIIIGDVLTGNKTGETVHIGILQEWFGFYWWTSRVFALLVVSLFVILPLLLLRRIDSLRYTSVLAFLLALVFVAISLVMAVQAFLEGKAQTLKLIPDFSEKGSVLDLFTTIPIYMTGFLYQINMHPVRAEIGEPSKMKRVIRMSLVIAAAFYFSIGFFGYLLFGDAINADMLVNFDLNPDNLLSLIINSIVRLSYAVHLMLVFPLINYALRANVDELLFPSKPDLTKDDTRFVCVTCVLLTLAYVIANAVPSVWFFFQLLGSTSSVSLVLIFPACIVLRDVQGISTASDKLAAIVLLLVALGTSLIVIFVNLFTST